MNYSKMEIKAASSLLLNVVILAGLMYFQKVYGNLYSYPVYALFFASRLKVFAEFFHEAVHHNISREYRRINDHIGFLLGVILFYSFKVYKKEHLLHHRKTGQSEDPTQLWFSHHRLHHSDRIALKLFILPLLGNQIPNYIRDIIRDLKMDRRYRAYVIAYILLLTTISIQGYGSEIIFLWVIPLFWIYPVLNFWNELIDHFKAPESARNFITSPVVTMLVTPISSNYHALHHKRPDIPWFALKAAYDGIEAKSGLVDVLKQFTDEGSGIDHRNST